jgi:hypothetical protein
MASFHPQLSGVQATAPHGSHYRYPALLSLLVGSTNHSVLVVFTANKDTSHSAALPSVVRQVLHGCPVVGETEMEVMSPVQASLLVRGGAGPQSQFCIAPAGWKFLI